MNEKKIGIRRRLRELEQPRLPDEDRRSERSLDAILNATIELVLSNGWQGLTIDGIAARAKVGKQTIYRWWPSKGAVLFDAAMAGGFAWPDFPETDDFQADLRSAVRNLVAEFSQPSFSALMRVLLVGAQEDRELARKVDGFISDEPVRTTISRIERAAVEGQLDVSVDPSGLADLIFGAVFRRWLLGTGKLDFEFADAIAAMATKAAGPA
ncbi:MAG: hypothetical protein QG596_1912 [Actinomycetota bacterium]|jgi:AcrR family transcriptional regulator|nr:hypothetical protein [Actinomycetota bacterium]